MADDHTPQPSTPFEPPHPDALIPVTPGESVVVAQRPRSKKALVGGIVAVVALVAGATFAFAAIRHNARSGGAASPTEAGTDLTDALGQEDVLGAIDVLLPGEREVFRQPLIDIVDNLKRMKIAGPTADLNKVPGFDIAFRDVAVKEKQTTAKDIVDIHVTGSATVSVDGKQVPIGDLLINDVFDGNRPNMDEPATTSALDWHLAAVEQDGRWYVSLLYSAAESARGDNDIPAKGVTPAGADTPEGAVKNMLDAAAKLDVKALIASLDPFEAAALQRYAPLFLDAADKAEPQGIDLTVSGTKFTVTGSGSRRSVGIDAMTVKGTYNDTDFTAALKDRCVTLDAGDTKYDSCDKKGVGTIEDSVDNTGLFDQQATADLVTAVRNTFADFHPSGIAVRQVNGKWFVSPIGSLTDMLIAVLRSVDAGELSKLISSVQAFVGSLGDATIAGD